MSYASLEFLVVLPAFLFLYLRIRGQQGRLLALLVASVLFYAYGEPLGVPVLLAVIALTYAGGILMALRPAWSGWVVAVVIVTLVLDLAALKYAAFIDETVGIALLPTAGPIPLGISFFTFEAIAYVVDLRRLVAATDPSPLRIALYIGLFPHLISGPIMRPNDILPQLRAPIHVDHVSLQSGLQLFVEGLVKKRVIADTAGVVVDQVFGAPDSYSTGAAWLAAIAYALQIYGDFSGYTDMGRGIARMLGFELPRNFDAPYAAIGIQDFWRRWHITLSRWLRDYVYIALGGSRRSTPGTYANVLVTMLIGGLWHGAGWTFVAWGAYHGMLLVIERATRWPTRIPWIAGAAMTFFLVLNGWVLFRARDFALYLVMLTRLYVPQAGANLTTSETLFVVGALVAVGGAMLTQRLRPATVEALRTPDWLSGLAYGLAGAAVLLFAPTATQPFIYFRF